ncbi:MAG: hypothetical protein ACM3O7_08825 [Acidobacteriota bacterium]
MFARPFLAASLCGFASHAAAQAVTSFRAPSGLPLAVVEVAGGDVEHIAVVLPPGTAAPAAVSGCPVDTFPRRGGAVFAFTVPATLAGPALGETLKLTSTLGSGGVVALGPAPARELATAAGALAEVPYRPPAPPGCVLTEGGLEIRRGSPERVALRLSLPGPEDPRFDLLPALASWVQTRLATAFPTVHVSLVDDQGCSRLLLEADPGSESPRSALARLRGALEALASAVPNADELSALTASVRRRSTVVARDGEEVAVRLADRLARGGSVAAAVAVPDVEPGTITALASALLVGHPGSAVITESERRAVPVSPRTLDNGVVISTRWVPGDVAVLALALGAVDTEAARPLLEAAAKQLSAHGWATELGEQTGVATLAVAVPTSDVVAALELLSDAVAGGRPGTTTGLEANVARALGLADRPSSEAVSLALTLPEESEEGLEAAEKFFSTLQSAGVRVAPVAPAAGLSWTPDAGAPELCGLVDLPATSEGLLAGEVITARLGKDSAVSSRWLSPTGHLVLELRAHGEASVPALDTRLAGVWKQARTPLRPGELAAATGRLSAVFFGDPTRATARMAAAVFLPVTPRLESMLGTEPTAVDAVLAALPPWDALPKLAMGPAPVAPTPRPARAVRESRPSRP